MKFFKKVWCKLTGGHRWMYRSYEIGDFHNLECPKCGGAWVGIAGYRLKDIRYFVDEKSPPNVKPNPNGIYNDRPPRKRRA